MENIETVCYILFIVTGASILLQQRFSARMKEYDEKIRKNAKIAGLLLLILGILLLCLS
jgi:hypothetical protein